MSDSAQTNLREPDQMNWDKHNAGSKFQAPPDALGPDGKPLIYKAQLPTTLGTPPTLGATDEGYRSFEVGPLKLVQNGNGADGYEIRFYTVNVKKFVNRRTQEPMEVSSASKVIRAAGVTARPQKNAEYEAAMRQAAGRVIQITLDWRAKDQQTGEEVVGFENFPIDPATNKRKAILKKGDVLPDGRIIASEVLFANARVKYVIDPTRK